MVVAQEGRVRIAPVIFFGLGLIILTILLDALIEAGFVQERVFETLLSPTFDELLIRLLLFLCELAFLAYIVYLLQRQNLLRGTLATALEEKQQAVDRSEAVLESFGDPISIQDLDLKVIYQNQAHRELMGNALGRFCYSAYHRRDDVCPECHLIAAYQDGRVHRREVLAPHSRRGEITVEIVATPLLDRGGKVVAGIEAVRDISERKRNETLLRSISAELAQRTDELSAANAELEAFGSTLAHDLRNHLAKISTAADVLSEVDALRLDNDGRYCVEAITTASESMDALIQSIMVLSRVTHRELQQEEVDLSALANDIALSLHTLNPERPVEFSIAAGQTAIGDRSLLRVVLENLLGNAWKYTRDQKPARIVFDAVERQGRKLFQVRDNGVGFSMDEAGQLFRPFGRLSTGQNFPGYGIGLSTVQRIILRHGGEIFAESTSDDGAVFSFSLPD